MQFESLHNVQCLVKIFDSDGWSGTPTALSPGDTPFAYEEDDSDDLTKLIRYRTGTLRVFVDEGEDIQDLYPATMTEHYVEFLYDGRLDFTGYIQPQTFEREWTVAARVDELQVVSPLGLAENLFFPPMIAQLIDLRSALFNMILPRLDADIYDVTFPAPVGSSILITDGKFRSMVIEKSRIAKNSADINRHYETEVVSYILEGMCNIMGCILHEEPGKLIFTRVNYDGRYVSLRKTGQTIQTYYLGTYGNSIVDVLSDHEIDNEATIETVLPVSRVKIKSDGDKFQQVTFPWNDCYRARVLSNSSNLDMVGNWPVSENGITDGTNGEWSSTRLFTPNNFSVDSSNKIVTDLNAGVVFAALFKIDEDNPSATQMPIIFSKNATSVANTYMVYTCYFAPPGPTSVITVKAIFAANLRALYDSPAISSYYVNPSLIVIHKESNTYLMYNSSDRVYQWTTAPSNITLSAENEIEFPSVIGTLEIHFLVKFNRSNLYFAIKEFSIDRKKDNMYDYTFNEDPAETLVPSEYYEVDPSFDTADITMQLSYPSTGFGDSNALRLQGIQYGEPLDSLLRSYEAKYGYLLKSQTRIQLPVTGSNIPYMHIPRYTLPGFSYPFRLIAYAFNPVDDERILTLHGNNKFIEESS